MPNIIAPVDSVTHLFPDPTMRALDGRYVPPVIPPTANVTSSTTLASGASPNQMCDASLAAITVTLPSSPTIGSTFLIIKTDSSVNAVTVAPSAGTINAAATYTLTTQYQYVRVLRTSSNWVVTGRN